MYRAKEMGRNTWQFYTPSMSERTLARLEIDDDHAELVVDGMQTAGSGRVYQVWTLQRGREEPVPGEDRVLFVKQLS